MVTVEIPVLPHVKSLLLSIHGAEPIAAHENNVLGKEIESILHSYSQCELFPQKLIGEKIKINVSQRVAPYYQRFQHAFDLGCFFEKQFHLILFTYVDAQMEGGVRQETAIKNFYVRHQINPELYDMIAARMSLMRTRRRKSDAA
jgi:hypothetical protein